MKRLLLFFLLLSCTPARGGVPCALPFNLQNGQPADATQVMANYNALVTCLGNAAAAGANSDITTLTALTTPITPGAGGSQTFTAAAISTGAANAQVVAATTPANFALTTGFTVVFIPGFTNTGATTLAVAGTAATNVFRRTTNGILPLAGGEIILGALNAVTFDGTQYQLMTGVPQVPIGTILDTIGATADPGFVLMQGQCLATTGVFNALWLKMGSPGVGGCGAANFPLPDGRGRVVAMLDSGGSTNLSTVCTSGVPYSTCGVQNLNLPQSALPQIDLQAQVGNGLSLTNNSAVLRITGSANSNSGTVANGSTISTIGLTGNIWLNGNVAQTATATVQPTLILNRQIKF